MKSIKENEKVRIFAEFIRNMGVKVIFDHLPGKGGWCRANGKFYVIINRKIKPYEKIEIFRDFLRNSGMNEKYMPPLIREEIDEGLLHSP